MLFFRKKKPSQLVINAKAAVEEVGKQIDITKVEHKDAVRENIEARQYTKKLLDENGFTLSMLVAMGGKHSSTMEGKHI